MKVMDPVSATVVQQIITVVGSIIVALITAWATIHAAQVRQTQDHGGQDQAAKRSKDPSELPRLSRSIYFVSLVIFFAAVFAVFIYIPFVSDYAFWFVVASYAMVVGTWPRLR